MAIKPPKVVKNLKNKTTSKTVKEAFLGEAIVGTDHRKTTISDGKNKVEGLGRTNKEAEQRASEKWSKRKK